MPSRWICLGIVLFWSVVMGPLLWQQAVERFTLGGEPPGYTIDLVDEAQRGPAEIHWDVRRTVEGCDGEDRYLARTSVIYHPETALFDLRVHLDGTPPEIGKKPLDNPVRINTIDSTYTVTKDGQLQKTSFKCNLLIKVMPLPVACQFDGEVRDGQFHSTLKGSSGGQDLEQVLNPVPVSRNGSVLNPLHPVNRIQGLRPGQEWTLPAVDPVRDAFKQMLSQEFSVPPRITGRVLPDPRVLRWNRTRDIPCLVIEYTQSGEPIAHTWVEQSSGLVLEQEARRDGEVWEFKRTSDIDGM